MSRLQCRLPRYAFAVFVLLMCPTPANAHLNSTGIGPIYDGMVHFLMSPEDLVPVLGLALLAGLRGPEYGRWTMFVVPGAWLVGGLAGTLSASRTPNQFVAAAWFLLIGGLLAADAKVSLRTIAALAGVMGLYHGYLNGTGMGDLSLAAVALLGLSFGIFVLVSLASALVVQLQRNWTLIAVRVCGSWIAASGFLILGWAVRMR